MEVVGDFCQSPCRVVPFLLGVCLPPIPLPRNLGSVLDLFTLRFHVGDVLILGKALVASPRIVLASVPWFRRQCKKKER